MSFNCTECEASFKTQRSLAIHNTKKHLLSQNLSCSKCAKKLSTVSNRKTHEKRCKKTQSVAVVNNTINNTNTNSNNTNINNTNSNNNTNINLFLQVNKHDKLMPITDDMLSYHTEELLKQGHAITSSKQFANLLFNQVLHKSVINTDTSRNTLNWLDGDNDSKLVKDKKGIKLTDKTFSATSDIFKEKRLLVKKRIRDFEEEAKEFQTELVDLTSYKYEQMHNQIVYCNNHITKQPSSCQDFAKTIGERSTDTTDINPNPVEDIYACISKFTIAFNSYIETHIKSIFYISTEQLGTNVAQSLKQFFTVDDEKEFCIFHNLSSKPPVKINPNLITYLMKLIIRKVKSLLFYINKDVICNLMVTTITDHKMNYIFYSTAVKEEAPRRLQEFYEGLIEGIRYTT